MPRWGDDYWMLDGQQVPHRDVQRQPAGYYPGISMDYTGGHWGYNQQVPGRRYPHADPGGSGAGYNGHPVGNFPSPYGRPSYHYYDLEWR